MLTDQGTRDAHLESSSHPTVAAQVDFLSREIERLLRTFERVGDERDHALGSARRAAARKIRWKLAEAREP